MCVCVCVGGGGGGGGAGGQGGGRRGNSVKIVFCPLLKRGSTLKRKSLISFGSNFCPFIVNPISGDWCMWQMESDYLLN